MIRIFRVHNREGALCPFFISPFPVSFQAVGFEQTHANITYSAGHWESKPTFEPVQLIRWHLSDLGSELHSRSLPHPKRRTKTMEADMAISTTQRRDFIESVIQQDILGDAIDWIAANLSPEDVFSVNELEEWAYENGYGEQKP